MNALVAKREPENPTARAVAILFLVFAAGFTWDFWVGLLGLICIVFSRSKKDLLCGIRLFATGVFICVQGGVVLRLLFEHEISWVTFFILNLPYLYGLAIWQWFGVRGAQALRAGTFWEEDWMKIWAQDCGMKW